MAQAYYQPADRFRQLFITDGGALVATPGQGVQAPTGAGQIISITGTVIPVAPSGACTNAQMAAGSFDGQIAIVTNESTVVANTITFNTAVATGLVLTDATPDAIVIKAASLAIFVWRASLNGGNGAWVHGTAFGG